MFKNVRWYICKVCGVELPEQCFPVDGHNSHRYIGRNYRGRTCLLCRLTLRDQEKWKDRYREKCISTRASHAKKWNVPVSFLETLGWNIDKMAQDCREAYEKHFQAEGKCCECGQHYEEMSHGLNDITLDIEDRDASAIYGKNTRWVCMSCNRRKGTMAKEDWNWFSLGAEKWRTHPHKPQVIQLSLGFDL